MADTGNYAGMKTWKWHPDEFIHVDGIPHVYTMLWLGAGQPPEDWTTYLSYVMVRPYTAWARGKDQSVVPVTKPISVASLQRRGHNVVLPKSWRTNK